MDTRKMIQSLSAVAIAITCASAALANQDSFYLAQAPAPKATLPATRAANAPLGVSGQGMTADRTVKMTEKTKYINVLQGTVVTIVNGNKSFTWKFDTLGAPKIELAKIAPADFGAGKVVVLVQEELVNGD
jgi:hypothetical protein